MKAVQIYACTISLLGLLLSSNSLADSNKAGVFVPPEKTTTVVVSAKDVNRVSCPVEIREVFWSQEKPVAVHYERNNAFVKFKTRVEGSRIDYAREPVDLHVVCAGEVYTMILVPQDVNSVTVRLGNKATKAIEETLANWGALPIEEQIKTLTLAAYRDDIPSSFPVENLETSGLRQVAVEAKGIGENDYAKIVLAAVPVKRFWARGLGMTVTEYSVYAPRGARFEYKSFLKDEFGDRIVAITVDQPMVKAFRTARVFIINWSPTNVDK